jgi:hypothetical protein
MQSNNNNKLQIEGNRWLEEHEERLRSRATTTRKLQIERNRRELSRRTRRKIAMQSNNNKKRKLQIEGNRHELIFKTRIEIAMQRNNNNNNNKLQIESS